MDKATKAAEKEMYRIMKYLVQTKDYGLKLFPKRDINDDLWTLTIYSDSDWASNKCTNYVEVPGTENCIAIKH